MKKYLFILLIFAFLNAKIVDEIVASVNNIPITSYDIEKFAKEYNIDNQKALDVLIEKKLVESEIKKFGISVDEYDIENALEKIASQNGMSSFDFKAYLKQKGELKKFKQKLKDDLLKQKLFDYIVRNNFKISEEEVKNYYENHKDEFSIFNTIQVVEYKANNPQVLKEIQKNPFLKLPAVTSQTKVYSFNELPNNLIYIFKNTKEGEFTPIINDGLNYVTYYIANKEGKIILPLQKVKNIIENKLFIQKRNQILNDYFTRLKSQAEIHIYTNTN